MTSSLKSKLNRLKSADKPRVEPPKPQLLEYSFRTPADEALFSLSADALRRIGCSGAFDPHRALFLDTETTGLSGGTGTVAFLVGLGRIEGETLIVQQYLMPSYAAESMLLETVARFSENCDTVVTFNGKSFDIPLLQSRHVMNRMTSPFDEMRHLDLIHPARRTWKLRLKDCSLANIEERILSTHREHDLPGSEVPQRYFDFLKSGDLRLLEDIIDHNRQDIISLVTLLISLCRAYAAPVEQTSMLDIFSVGKTLEKQGEREEAKKCYERAAQRVPLTDLSRLREAKCAPMAQKNLSLMLRREGQLEQAEQIWLEMARTRPQDSFAHIELAKLYEHRDRDFSKALSHTLQALDCAQDEKERAALLLRKERLSRKEYLNQKERLTNTTDQAKK